MFQDNEARSERRPPLKNDQNRLFRHLWLHLPQLCAAQVHQQPLRHRGGGVRQRRARSKHRLAGTDLESPQPDHIPGPGITKFTIPDNLT